MVFLIGMTINRWWRVDAWVPVFIAMPRMLTELRRDPGSGLLSYRLLVGPGGVTVVQYWRSADDLYGYAADRDSRHRPAWSAFYRRARRKPGLVGIWHETYTTAGAQTTYVDTPPIGLAAATGVRAYVGHQRPGQGRPRPA